MTNKGKLIESVYKADLNQRATLVIFYLINRADQENTCFPSIKTISKECNVSTRTVQRALNDLEDAGFLMRESRFHVQGGQRSNLYHLTEVEGTEHNDSFASKTEDKTFEVSHEPCDSEKSINTETGYERVSLETEEISINNSSIEKVDFDTFFVIKTSGNLLTGTPCQDGIP